MKKVWQLGFIALALGFCQVGVAGSFLSALEGLVGQKAQQANAILVMNDRSDAITLEQISYSINGHFSQHALHKHSKHNLFKTDQYFDFIIVRAVTGKYKGEVFSVCHNERMLSNGHISISEENGKLVCEAVDNSIRM